MNIRLLPIALAASLTLAACGGGGDAVVVPPSATTEPPQPQTSETTVPEVDPPVVTISNSRFGVRELRIAPGTTVVFENTDPYAHTVTSTEASPMFFDSGELTQSETFEVTFDDRGEFSYFCQIHPTMRAVVIVE